MTPMTGHDFRTRIAKLPRGPAWALAFVVLVHAAGAWHFDQPVACENLRRRTQALTADARPALLMAGDSRVHCGLIPAVVAGELGLPAPQAVNLAVAASDSSTVWSAYREFSSRFADRPILLLGVSPFWVNDGADQLIGDELLWGLSFRERCRLVPPGRAIAACFLPEKALWNAWTSFGLSEDRISRDGGYVPKYGRLDLTRLGPRDRREAAEALESQWYDRPCLNGLRWANFERDLQAFAAAGTQLVLLDLPRHPAFAELCPRTPNLDRQFHEQLTELGRRMNVPVLLCPPDWTGQVHPDLLFYDFVHLNCRGAEAYSRWLGNRLREMARAGLVQLNPGGALLAARPAPDSCTAQDR